MISKRRVSGDLILQTLLIGIILPAYYFYWFNWVYPAWVLLIWQYIYNVRLKKYFHYALRLRFNLAVRAMLVIMILTQVFTDHGSIVMKALLTLLGASGYFISVRDFISRWMWPRRFWSLR